MTCKDCIHFCVCDNFCFVDYKPCNKGFQNKADVQEALEKQIPKKPLNDVDIIGDQGDSFLFKNKYCPNCLAKVETHGKYGLPSNRDKYCSYCGQALDWSDYN